MNTELLKAGDKMRREVVGDERVDNLSQNTTEFDHDFQALVTEYCWGNVWSKGVLDNKQRSLNNLCILSALNRSAEFELHLRGALKNGCSMEEIRDTLTQVTIYCGVPAGVEAFRIARRVFDDIGLELNKQPFSTT